jgi:peroxiredoxin
MKKLFIILILFFVFSLKLTYAQSYDFELNDLDGNSVKLSEMLKKGPVLIQFWALWCIPCKEEMKHLGEIYGKYKDSGFVYLAVNEDSPKSSAKVKSYIESKEYKFSVLLDGDARVFEQFGGQNLPFSVFLNKNGDVFRTYTSYVAGDEAELEKDVKQALNESKSEK